MPYPGSVLAYLATKGQFLKDAGSIEDIVQVAVRNNLGVHIQKGSTEYKSWQNSLGFHMQLVLQHTAIPDDAGVAVEYRLKGRLQRIDFMVSGFDVRGTRSVVVIELKQWEEIKRSELRDHVKTYLGGRERDVQHPSYQAHSYASVLEDFYEFVTSDPILIKPCAFLHNCKDPTVLRDSSMDHLLLEAPVFIRKEVHGLQRFIVQALKRGDGGDGLRRIEESPQTPSPKLVEALSEMLKGHPAFTLIDEQKTAFEQIVAFATKSDDGTKKTLIVNGGPGTGKSVIALRALAELLSQNQQVLYVTKNAAPRTVYQNMLRSRSDNARDISNLFVNSGEFYDSTKIAKDHYDVLLVDETHRLVKKSGFYRNLGDNQVAEIISAANVSVFFLDESQRVTWTDIGTAEEISTCATLLHSTVTVTKLKAQFRCGGSDEYIDWVDSLLGYEAPSTGRLADATYEVDVIDSPSELRELIFEKNREGNASRLLAGYCWDWKSKKNSQLDDIVFPGTDFAMKWNLETDGPAWMIATNSVKEVGCIHTCQGLEGDYMGVIIGDDLVIRDGRVVTNPDARAKTDSSMKGWKSAAKKDREGTLKKTDLLIRNTYRTLLTRGMRGTFIYCTDSETLDYFKYRLELAKRTAPGDTIWER